MTRHDIPIESISALLDYNWNDERADWEKHDQEDGHIFTHMMKIDSWLLRVREQLWEGKRCTP